MVWKKLEEIPQVNLEAMVHVLLLSHIWEEGGTSSCNRLLLVFKGPCCSCERKVWTLQAWFGGSFPTHTYTLRRNKTCLGIYIHKLPPEILPLCISSDHSVFHNNGATFKACKDLVWSVFWQGQCQGLNDGMKVLQQKLHNKFRGVRFSRSQTICWQIPSQEHRDCFHHC